MTEVNENPYGVDTRTPGQSILFASSHYPIEIASVDFLQSEEKGTCGYSIQGRIIEGPYADEGAMLSGRVGSFWFSTGAPKTNKQGEEYVSGYISQCNGVILGVTGQQPDYSAVVNCGGPAPIPGVGRENESANRLALAHWFMSLDNAAKEAFTKQYCRHEQFMNATGKRVVFIEGAYKDKVIDGEERTVYEQSLRRVYAFDDSEKGWHMVKAPSIQQQEAFIREHTA